METPGQRPALWHRSVRRAWGQLAQLLHADGWQQLCKTIGRGGGHGVRARHCRGLPPAAPPATIRLLRQIFSHAFAYFGGAAQSPHPPSSETDPSYPPKFRRRRRRWGISSSSRRRHAHAGALHNRRSSSPRPAGCLATVGAQAGDYGESKRLVVGSPRSQFTSECQRF
eukprot:COSAG01_NODE_3430_length_6105_cov_6.934565_8_plen_169_part_00